MLSLLHYYYYYIGRVCTMSSMFYARALKNAVCCLVRAGWLGGLCCYSRCHANNNAIRYSSSSQRMDSPAPLSIHPPPLPLLFKIIMHCSALVTVNHNNYVPIITNSSSQPASQRLAIPEDIVIHKVLISRHSIWTVLVWLEP